jgi:ELWxxDGT repeat protein
MKRFLRFSFILVLVANTHFCSAQVFTLLKDINPTTGSIPRPELSYNGWMYFSAEDGVHGRELWKTDGTSANTVLVKDIYPGATDAEPSGLVVFNNKIYFEAKDPVNGSELWVTDGTEAGTVLFKDINPGIGNSNPFPIFISNGSILFFANDGVHGKELWKSDGTVLGTTLLKDINVGSGSSATTWAFNAIGNTVFFPAYDGAADQGFHGTELWKTDGTAAGTVMVKDINPTIHPSDQYAGSMPSDMINWNGILYFRANGAKDNSEVWRSDGTEAGTYLLKEINPGLSGLTSGSAPNYFSIVNGMLLFEATDLTSGFELWKTDGTEAGTVMVKDIYLAGGSSPTRLRVMGNNVYFAATDPVNGRELWKSDGTAEGTILVKDIYAGPTDSYPWCHSVISNRLYFNADDGINGTEMWVSDGSEAGTHMVQNLAPGNEISNPAGIWTINGKLLMVAITVTTNWEFWVADDIIPIALPLHLLEFKGNLANNDALLQWKTENEVNTTSFVVERSTDGSHYSPVGTITAAKTAGVNLYNYTDVNIPSFGASVVYYRLRQIDADSKFTYSRIVALALDKRKNFAMLYPNPVRNEVNLTITLSRKDRLNWQLVDNSGRIIKNGSINHSGGSMAISIDVSNISAGNYLMRLNGESLQQTIKVIKQ